LSVGRGGLTRKAEVVFHIAIAKTEVGLGNSLKFVEYVFVGLAQDVGQNIEATAVGHADHHAFHTELSGSVDGGVERGYGVFSTFERESLLSDEFFVEEVFKHHRFVELT